jgi:hypothetical protein
VRAGADVRGGGEGEAEGWCERWRCMLEEGCEHAEAHAVLPVPAGTRAVPRCVAAMPGLLSVWAGNALLAVALVGTLAVDLGAHVGVACTAI